MDKIINVIKKVWPVVSKVLVSIGPIILLIGYISKLSVWGNEHIFVFIRLHFVIFWLISLTIIVFVLTGWLISINKKHFGGFSDSFKGRLESKWDFIGPWKILDDKILFITGSDEGGITKVGSDWENYILTFKAKIICGRVGVIVRARDLNNYYMLQINKKHIVPHRRATVLQIKDRSVDPIVPPEIEMQVGWQVYNDSVNELNRELLDWFDVYIKVVGHSIIMKINNEIVFQQDMFLQISNGKIGFRCHDQESAQIKEVKVRIIK
jgi:hypothetical protein